MQAYSLRGVAWLAAFVAALACNSRELGALSEEQDTTDSDPGDRPMSPGSMYSACTDTSTCAPLEFCVFPQGEAGFCTAACGPREDPAPCNDAPSDDRSPICMSIGLPDSRTVCALGCDGLSCPNGMRCEEVDAPTGAQLACF
ncbi:MAG: hypothetical protein JKY37_16365 [Nannocystaceae bacterium]|nr:hypothetical protein [Nannocystaceae bacterium]